MRLPERISFLGDLDSAQAELDIAMTLDPTACPRVCKYGQCHGGAQ